mgnify:CR=1 FL=1
MKLKLLWFLPFVLLLFPFIGRSQQVHSFWLSGSGGINSDWILNQNAYGNPEMAYATTFGLSGGLGANYFMSREWGISGSLFLSKLGQNYYGEQSGAIADRKVKLTYLEMPVMIMRNIPYMNYPTWISAGPGFRFLVKGYQDYSREEGGQPLPNETGMIKGDVTDRFKPIDIAINFSINRMVELNYSRSIMFIFSIDSSFGLMDINDVDWQISNTHGEYAASHNFYIGVKAGLMFKAARFGGSRW